MYLALCFDEGMLIRALFGLLILGVLCGTPIILGLLAFARWADARRERPAANAPNLR